MVFVDAGRPRRRPWSRSNLAHCGIADGYAMIRAEFARALRQLPADRRFDLALLDPPYDLADLAAVVAAAAGRMAPGGVLVLEHAIAPAGAADGRGDSRSVRQVTRRGQRR